MVWDPNAIGNGSAGKTIAGMADEGLEHSGGSREFTAEQALH